MISRKLVRQIESQSDHLARQVAETVRGHSKTPAYQELEAEELRRAVDDVLHNLGSWLTTRSETAIENYYRKTGMQRRLQGMPQSQVVHALHIAQEIVLRFVRTSMMADADEQGFETDLALGIVEFFDSAVYGVALGYESAEPADVPQPAAGSAAFASNRAPVEDIDWDPTSRAGEVGEVSG